MENSHDIVLIITIGAIIILQIYVFWRNYQKIQDYKKTVQNVKDFEIVEVSVPEEWVKSIEVDEILNNPEAFQNISSQFSSRMTESTDDPESYASYIAQNQHLNEDEEFPEELEFPENYNEELEYEEQKNKRNKR